MAIAVTGCPPQHTSPIVEVRPETEAERQFEAHWLAALKVLRKYRFKIDVQDRRRGLIVSEPMVAKHFFEFWRRDATSTYDLVEGSLQTVYLVAAVNITRADPNGSDYEVDVEVRRIRSDRIEPRSVGAAGTKSSSEAADSTGGNRPGEAERGSMVHLGEDETLALYLSAGIEDEAILQLASLSASP